MPTKNPVARASARLALALCALAAASAPAGQARAEPGAAAALAPTSLAGASGPASVRGLADAASLDVFTGQARTAIAIELPPAAAGFVPPLALRYDGALGSGPVGLGWQLAVPRIVRSLRHGVPAFAADDELELLEVAGGGRLVQVAPGAYRLAGAGEQVRILGGPDQGFTVDDGSGRRYAFGATAREGAVGRTVSWLLESVEDVGGERATYSHTYDGGTAYLTCVAWGDEGRQSAALSYTERPDPVLSMRGGLPQRLSQRLAAIEIRVGGALRSRYALSYVDAPGLSRLAEVSVVGRDGVTALPPTRLTYTGGSTPRVFELADTRGWRLNARGCVLFDVDGDGIADFFQAETAAFRRGTGDGLGATLQTRAMLAAAPESSRFIDLDGDGRVELVLDGGGQGWRVARLDPDTLAWQRPTFWPGTRGLPLTRPSVVLTDLNGDGLPDLVRQGDSYLTVWMGGRTGMGPPRRLPAPNSARALIGGGRERWADVNGDGLADLLALDDSGAHVFLGHGDGTFLDVGAFAYPWGDGLSVSARVSVADVDRDGLADLVYTVHGHVTWYVGRAAGGWSRAGQHLAPPTSAPGSPTLGDIDGNGSLDLVWPSGWVADLAGPTHAGMLASIDNGLGAVTRFTYSSSAAQMVAAERRQRPWARTMPAAIAVVSQIDLEVAGGRTQTTRLTVRDAVWDFDERRFAGFLAGERTSVGDEVTASLQETTCFHEGRGDDRVLRGHALSRQLAGDAPLERREWSWRTAAPPPPATATDPALRLALMVREQVWLQDADAGPPPKIQTDYTYDATGNSVRVHRHGQVDVDGDESIDVHQYAASDSPWIRGVLTASQRRDGHGELVTSERFFYDGGTDPLPLGQVTRGWQRRAEALLLSEGRWVARTRTDFDARGNAVATVDQGQARTFAFDPHGVHVVQETLSTGARVLAWQLRWDEVLGAPVYLVGPDGVGLRTDYDALGRPIARARDGAPPHLAYAYDWRAPTPRTLTTEHDGAAGERRRTDVADSLGRPLYGLVELGPGQVVVEGWRRYGARGDVAVAALPFVSTSPATVAAPGRDVPAQTFAYDPLGRCVVTRAANGATRETRFAGLTTALSQTDLAPLVYHRDGAGRVRQTLRQVPGQPEVAEADYDAAGNLTALRLDGGAVAYGVAYDSLGRHVRSDDPDTGTRHYTWDDADRLVATVDASGARAAYTYDQAGRLVRRDGGGGGPTHYHYDLPRRGDGRHTMGRLAWAEDPAGTTHFSYDAAGRPDATVRILGGRSVRRQLTYSPAGLLLAMATDGTTLTYRYDGAGRLVAIDGVWEATALAPDGAVLGERYGNGVVQHTVRDALQLPVETSIIRDGTALLDLRAAYTAFGALVAVDDLDGVGRDHTARYQHDAAARLVRAEVGAHAFVYAYDALQNLVTRDVTGPPGADIAAGAYAHAVPGRPRQLSGAAGAAIAYDAAGRMVASGAAQMAYDGLNRLVRAQLADGRAVAHTYGYDGERAISDGPAGRALQFFPDLSEGPEGREQRILVGARTVARIVTPASGGPPRRIYHHATLTDGASLLTDATGQVLDERLYEPFGAALATDPAADGHGRADRYRDPATGWVDHGARWADPRLASWLSPDPPALVPDATAMLAPWDLHPYQYLRQSPNLFRDPDGRFIQVLAMGAGGAAVSVGLYALQQAYVGEPMTWSMVGVAATTGAVAGGVGALFRGVGVGIAMLSGAASGAAAGTVGRGLVGEEQSVRAVASDAAVGALTGGLGHAGSRLIDKLAPVRPPAAPVAGANLLPSAQLSRRWQTVLSGSRPGDGTRGPTTQFVKAGGFRRANREFDRLVRGFDVRTKTNQAGHIVRVAKLGHEVKAIVRPTSSSGLPTLELQVGAKRFKVRYEK